MFASLGDVEKTWLTQQSTSDEKVNSLESRDVMITSQWNNSNMSFS